MLFFFVFISLINCENLRECFSGCDKNSLFCFPRVIWSYWDSPNIPEDIQEILRIKRKALRNFTFFFLSEKNLSIALNISSFPERFDKLWPSGKADYIRVCLLEKFGGFWIDSGVLVNSGEDLESIISNATRKRSNLVGFGERHQVQASFFGAPKDSDFMKKFKAEMDLMISMGPENYCYVTCIELKSQFKLNYDINCRPYWVIDLVMQKICLQNSSLYSRVLRLQRYLSPYRLHDLCHGSLECVRYRLLHDREVRRIPYIAIGHRIRNGKRFHLDDDDYLNFISYTQWKKKKKKISSRKLY